MSAWTFTLTEVDVVTGLPGVPATLTVIDGGVGGVGPQGPAGVAGPAGPAGVDGIDGAPGATGPAGATGPQGPAGDPGPAGADGAPGPAGADSTVPGPAGPAGPQGDPGPAGPAGADSTVPGPTGPAGPAGVDGEDGAPGATGATGPAGPAGPAGADGATGATGATGPAGPGVPVGGTDGQVLTKTSAVDYETAWETPSAPDLDAVEVSVLPTPTPNVQHLFAVDVNGVSSFRTQDENGIVTDIQRDNSLIVRNETGVTIAKGALVAIGGVSSSSHGLPPTRLPTVVLARGDSAATSPAIGVTLTAITNNSAGRVITAGMVTGLDTSAFTTGQRLWMSGTVAGAISATKPTPPVREQRVAQVVRVSSTDGQLLVDCVAQFEKGLADGLASLGSTGLVPTSQLGTGTANATTFLRGDGTYATPAGGGGSAYTQELNLPLTTLTGWASEVGTWTATATHIEQVTANATEKFLRYDSLLIPPDGVFQVEIAVTAGTGDDRAGINISHGLTAATGGVLFYLGGNGTVVNEISTARALQAVYSTNTLSSTVAYGTYLTLRVERAGETYRVYVDGTPITVVTMASVAGIRPRLALYSYLGAARFRNLKVWGPTLPA